MNKLDIFLALPLIWSTYNGFKKGLVLELVASLLLFFALKKGIPLFYLLSPMLKKQLPTFSDYTSIALAIALFTIGGIGIYLLAKLMQKILHITLLGILDNILGALLGLAKAACFISLLIYFWNYSLLAPLPSDYIANSRLFPLLEAIVPKILQIHQMI